MGAADFAEVVCHLRWNSGSKTTTTIFQGGGSDGHTNIDLRNLGHGATLPLFNGKRKGLSWYYDLCNASTNIDELIPNIASERIELVWDGAPTVCSFDAIAGVVNFLTKKTFEGFDTTYQLTTDEETGEVDAH